MQLEEIAEIGDGWTLEMLNDKLHATVNECANSPRLAWFYNSVLPLPQYSRRVSGWIDMSIRDHRLIVDALRARDVQASRSLMEDHVRHAGDLLTRHLEAEGRWPEGTGQGLA